MTRLNQRDSTTECIFLPRLWAACIAVLFAHLAIQAVAPLFRSWDLTDVAQEGQLTVYNNIQDGGLFGVPIEIADWDGDGLTDLALAPMRVASGPGESRIEGGVVYLHRGASEISGVIDLDETPAAVTLWGAYRGDQLGTELFTADLNGDGLEDLIMGAQNHDGVDRECINCGAVYVLFGNARLFDDPGRVIDTALPTPGLLAIYGGAIGGRLGVWVEAGDLDGDGLADLVMGADQTSGDGDPADADQHRGTVVVLYGRETFPMSIQLDSRQSADLPGLTRILGRDREDHFGGSLHCVDLNGDGLDELIVGSAVERRSAVMGGEAGIPAHGTVGGDGPDGTRAEAGEVAIVFSRPGGERLPERLDLREPPAEFLDRISHIYGSDSMDLFGEEITSGDFDDDGQQDLVVGALRARNPEGNELAGKAYAFYWNPGLEGVEIDLAAGQGGLIPPGAEVSVMYGLAPPDLLGDTLSTADFDQDGIDDLAVGIPNTTVEERDSAGMVALVYGQSSRWPDFWAPQAASLPDRLRVAYILGAEAHDLLSYSMEARDHDGDGYADVFSNAMQGDGRNNQHRRAGEAYIVSGYRISETELKLTRVVPGTGHMSSRTPAHLIGEGFTTEDDVTVTVSGETLDAVTVVDGHEIVVTLPASAREGPVAVTVATRYGSVTLQDAFTYLPDEQFVRGDADLDLHVRITDSIVILDHLLGAESLRCMDAGDGDDSGAVNLADAVYVLAYLFQGGSPPPPPFPDLGSDATVDELGCEGPR